MSYLLCLQVIQAVLTSVISCFTRCLEVLAQLFFTVLFRHFHTNVIEPLPLSSQVALELGSVLLQNLVSFRQSIGMGLNHSNKQKYQEFILAGSMNTRHLI